MSDNEFLLPTSYENFIVP